MSPPSRTRSNNSTTNSSRQNMHYVVLRDDDTNATTPVECLEQLYRPFLDRGLPVNLAVIPDVRLDAARADGSKEEFLWPNRDQNPNPPDGTAAIASNP